jgi:hypothetical protein
MREYWQDRSKPGKRFLMIAPVTGGSGLEIQTSVGIFRIYCASKVQLRLYVVGGTMLATA